MLNKKRLGLIIVGIVLSVLLFISTTNVFAVDTTSVVLSDNNITVNNEKISNDTTQSVYLSNEMNNGGSNEEAKEANKEITNIVNIENSGTYEFTGKLSDGQIAVNTNKINGDVIIILNNVEITCENAPAIFIYNKETKSSTCNVKIKTAKDSINIISGGKIKQSVEGWENQEELLYNVEKNYNDEGEYFERYKYDGAISSDISITFEGEGTLTVNSLSKEGIEAKRDITINSGNLIINSLDDGMNACADGESVITINGGVILVNVLEEADEGDAIDSNGYVYINGGTVYAFASEKSEDSGLDSDLGIYINGGTVVATGNMADEVSDNSKQKFLQLQFISKVESDSIIAITDKDKNPVTALKTDRAYKVLTISMPEFTDEEYSVYEGGTIEGTNENGLYTKITSYTGGTEKEYRSTTEMGKPGEFNRNMQDIAFNTQNIKVYYYTIICLTIILLVVLIVAIISKKTGKIFMLFIGLLIGAIIATSGFMIYNRITENNKKEMIEEQKQINMEKMEKPEDMGMPNEKMQEKEPAEMPKEGEMR